MVYDHHAAPVYGPASGFVDSRGFDYLPKVLTRAARKRLQLRIITHPLDQ